MFDGNSSSLPEWVEQNTKKLDCEQRGLFLIICWYIWQARNDKLWNNCSTNATYVVLRAKSHFMEWKTLNEKELVDQAHVVSSKWTKPEPGWLKINVDAALDVRKGGMGLGWVIRDANGIFKAARAVPVTGVCSPTEAETMAIRELLSWLKDQSPSQVLIETDALKVVQGLNSCSFDSAFDLLLCDVRDLLRSFSSTFISFVKRSANRAAHLVAREALSLSDCRLARVTKPTPDLITLFAIYREVGSYAITDAEASCVLGNSDSSESSEEGFEEKNLKEYWQMQFVEAVKCGVGFNGD
nr:uncharacterized protein LOC109164833 [Ipomoea batatas]